MLTCFYCVQERFATVPILREHLAVDHLEYSPYECCECPAKFGTEAAIDDHYQNFHKMEEYHYVFWINFPEDHDFMLDYDIYYSLKLTRHIAQERERGERPPAPTSKMYALMVFDDPPVSEFYPSAAQLDAEEDSEEPEEPVLSPEVGTFEPAPSETTDGPEEPEPFPKAESSESAPAEAMHDEPALSSNAEMAKPALPEGAEEPKEPVLSSEAGTSEKPPSEVTDAPEEPEPSPKTSARAPSEAMEGLEEPMLSPKAEPSEKSTPEVTDGLGKSVPLPTAGMSELIDPEVAEGAHEPALAPKAEPSDPVAPEHFNDDCDIPEYKPKIIKKVQCLKCEKMTSGYRSGRYHHANVCHLKIPIYECKICKKTWCTFDKKEPLLHAKQAHKSATAIIDHKKTIHDELRRAVESCFAKEDCPEAEKPGKPRVCAKMEPTSTPPTPEKAKTKPTSTLSTPQKGENPVVKMEAEDDTIAARTRKRKINVTC